MMFVLLMEAVYASSVVTWQKRGCAGGLNKGLGGYLVGIGQLCL